MYPEKMAKLLGNDISNPGLVRDVCKELIKISEEKAIEFAKNEISIRREVIQIALALGDENIIFAPIETIDVEYNQSDNHCDVSFDKPQSVAWGNAYVYIARSSEWPLYPEIFAVDRNPTGDLEKSNEKTCRICLNRRKTNGIMFYSQIVEPEEGKTKTAISYIDERGIHRGDYKSASLDVRVSEDFWCPMFEEPIKGSS